MSIVIVYVRLFSWPTQSYISFISMVHVVLYITGIVITWMIKPNVCLSMLSIVKMSLSKTVPKMDPVVFMWCTTGGLFFHLLYYHVFDIHCNTDVAAYKLNPSHRQLDCLFNRLFRLTSHKISKLALLTLYERYPSVISLIESCWGVRHTRLIYTFPKSVYVAWFGACPHQLEI